MPTGDKPYIRSISPAEYPRLPGPTPSDHVLRTSGELKNLERICIDFVFDHK